MVMTFLCFVSFNLIIGSLVEFRPPIQTNVPMKIAKMMNVLVEIELDIVATE